MAYGDYNATWKGWRNYSNYTSYDLSDASTSAPSGDEGTAASGPCIRELSLVDTIFTALAKHHASRQVVAAAVAAVLRTSVSLGAASEPPNDEVAARLDALRPCIAAQVSASAQLGHNLHTCRGLVPPVVKLRGDIARHSGFDGSFTELTEGDMRDLQRAASRSKKAAARTAAGEATTGAVIDCNVSAEAAAGERELVPPPPSSTAPCTDASGTAAPMPAAAPPCASNTAPAPPPASMCVCFGTLEQCTAYSQYMGFGLPGAAAAIAKLRTTQPTAPAMPPAVEEVGSAPGASDASTMTEEALTADIGVGTARPRFVSKATQCLGMKEKGEGAGPPGRVLEGEHDIVPDKCTASSTIDPFVENDPWAAACGRLSPAVAATTCEAVDSAPPHVEEDLRNDEPVHTVSLHDVCQRGITLCEVGAAIATSSLQLDADHLAPWLTFGSREASLRAVKVAIENLCNFLCRTGASDDYATTVRNIRLCGMALLEMLRNVP
jgi:hypothetical protein